MNKLKVLDLFSGLGGFSLGLERTGHFETVAFCDNDKFSKAILDKHWKGIKVYDDVREITKEKFKEDEIEFPDIITGGFPCQPFSVAGKQQGTGDDRHLWPEMFRIIKAFKPRFVIGENVRGIVNIQDGVVFETVCTNLEDEGYEVQPFLIPAASVGAPHRRERVWFIASLVNTEHDGLSTSKIEGSSAASSDNNEKGQNETSESKRTSGPRDGINVADTNDEGVRTRIGGSDNDHETESRSWRADGERGSSVVERNNSTSTEIKGMDVADTKSIGSDVGRRSEHSETWNGQREIGGENSQDDANSNEEGLQGFRQSRNQLNKRFSLRSEGSEGEHGTVGQGWWSVEPNVGRVAHGVPGRVYRLKGLGNSIVPQIVEEIGKALIKAQRTD
jgi:DNA (cytosine-5)-methyltransferase 1